MRTEKKCTANECVRKHYANGLCNTHYSRLRRHGTISATRKPGVGYANVIHNGKITQEHIVIAERALGRSLPAGAVVHHVNGNRRDNRPQNLVICPNSSYHIQIHARERAMNECGDPAKRKCRRCHQYDDLANMRTGDNGHHYSHLVRCP